MKCQFALKQAAVAVFFLCRYFFLHLRRIVKAYQGVLSQALQQFAV